MNRAPLLPGYPERVCWGCTKYCAADDLGCGNGTIRTMHPVELFGEDWLEWSEARRHRIVRPKKEKKMSGPTQP